MSTKLKAKFKGILILLLAAAVPLLAAAPIAAAHYAQAAPHAQAAHTQQAPHAQAAPHAQQAAHTQQAPHAQQAAHTQQAPHAQQAADPGPADAFKYETYEDIPGVTAEEIEAIEKIRREVEERGYPLIVGTTYNTESFVTIDGTIGGFIPLFCGWLTDLFGIGFVTEIYALNDMLSGMLTGEVDFGINAYTPERLAVYYLSEPIINRTLKVMRIPGSLPAEEIMRTRPVRYAFLENATQYGIVSELLPHGSFEPVFGENYDSLYHILANGEADAMIVYNTSEASFDVYGGVIVEDFLPLTFIPLSLSSGLDGLEPVLSVVTKALNSGAYNQFTRMYSQGYDDYIRNKFLMQLTDEERAYIRDNPVIPYATTYESYPDSFYDENDGVWKGMVVDILGELEQLTGFTFERINDSKSELPALLSMLESGQAYFIPCLHQNEERKERFILSDVVFLHDSFSLLSKSSYPDIELNDIPYERIGFYEGSVFADALRRWFPNALYATEYPSITDTFIAIERGEIDLILTSRNRLLALTNYYELSDYKANFNFDIALGGSFAYNKEQPVLASILDKALLLINTERIVDHWQSRTYNLEAMQLRAQRPWLIGAIVAVSAMFVFTLIMLANNSGKRRIIAKQTDELSLINKELLAAKNDLSRSLEIMTETLNKSGALIMVSDPITDEIIFVTDAINELLGFDRDVRGEFCYKAFRGADSRCDYCPCHQLDREPGKIVYWEQELPHGYYLYRNCYVDWPGGKKVHIQFAVDVTEIKKTQETLQEREKLLQTLNEVAVVFLSHGYDDFVDMMNRGMKLLSDTFGLDGLSVFRVFESPDGMDVQQVYNWDIQEGTIEPPEELAQRFSLREIAPNWALSFGAGLQLNGPKSSMCAEEMALMEKYGIVSLCATPVFFEGKLWGFVLFEGKKSERYFSDVSTEVMRSAAFLCVNAITHAEASKEFSEQAMRLASEEMAQTILDTAPYGTNIWDEDLNILFVNNELVRLFNLGSKEEFVNSFDDIFPKYQPGGVLSKDMVVAELKKGFQEGYNRFEIINTNNKGEVIPNEITFVRIKYKGKDVLIAYSRDLREHKAYLAEIEKSREELMKAKDAAEAASQAKSDFLAKMSHEIRTPMNSVIGFAELARDYCDVIPDQVTEYMSNISESAQWLLSIINDILDVSKIESGKMELEYIPFDIRNIVSFCQSITMPKAVEKGLAMHSNIELPAGKRQVGDPARLRQVLLNLLSNAVKFTDEGAVTLSVVAEDSEGGNMTVSFEVSDSGIGMSPEQIKTIFEPFSQADNTINRRYGGTGLGLTICKKIIEAMGGHVDVESEPGAGSKFSFALTFETTALEDTVSYGAAVRTGETPSFTGEVLVCEDNEMNQKVISRQLQRVGITPVLFENGAQACDAVRERKLSGGKPFDLIFMDIYMPVMSGLEASAIISKLGVSTPIVALTANVMPGDLETYKKSGIADCLGKPFTSFELCQCLGKYLKRLETPRAGRGFEGGSSPGAGGAPLGGAPLGGAPLGGAPGDVDFAGDEQMQNSFKILFAKNNKNTFENFIGALDRGDIKQAYVLAHTLKSNAGFIGEKRMQRYAAAVENALRGEKNRLTDKQLNNFKSELASVLKKLSPLLEEDAPSRPPPLTDGQIDAALAKLETLLKSSNTECIDLIPELLAVPGAQELVRQVEEFNFAKALRELEEIKQRRYK